VALEMFLVPNHVLDGGLTGISLMLNYKTGIVLGTLTFILNLPFVILGGKVLEKRFSILYLYAMIILTIFTTMFHDIPAVTQDELLAIAFGGAMLGIGVGLVIKGGACLDGTELLAMMLSKKFPTSTGEIILIMNLIIFSISAVMFGIDRAMLSLLTYFIASKLIDHVEAGINDTKQAFIICNNGTEISQDIYTNLGRTSTLIEAKGLISGKKDLVYCVLTRIEIIKLKQIIDSYDDSAFISISDVSEIIGNHIKRKRINKEV
jgi:uncharacterized membrane-anchored protein YitT (DUF2179 family)